MFACLYLRKVMHNGVHKVGIEFGRVNLKR